MTPMSADAPEPNEKPPGRMPVVLRLRVAAAAVMLAVALGGLFWAGVEYDLPQKARESAEARRAAGQHLSAVCLEAARVLIYALPVLIVPVLVVAGQALAGRKTGLMRWMMANLKGFDDHKP